MRQTIPNIIFHQGLPDREELEALSEGMDHVVLVLDDLMLKITGSEECVQLFALNSHHKRQSIVFLTHNLYPPGKYARSISLNCASHHLSSGDKCAWLLVSPPWGGIRGRYTSIASSIVILLGCCCPELKELSCCYTALKELWCCCCWVLCLFFMCLF
jgi:hypothetical protein